MSIDALDDILTVEHLRPKLPSRPRVAEIRYRPDVDSMGEESLRIYVVLDDDTLESDRSWKSVKPIHDAIRGTLHQAGIERWPYIRFRKKNEMTEAELTG